jgi:hypothetical protein
MRPANIMATGRMSMSLPPAVHPLPGGAPEIADDIPAMIGGARQESAFFLQLAPFCSPMLCGAASSVPVQTPRVLPRG